jgi:lipid II isoglutaminyl synthase (glutamine-hydrolysing)
MKLTIAHLYPKHLNIYGDQGNLDALVFRLKARKIKVTVKPIGPNDPLVAGSFDLLFSGGGQDRHQLMVAKNLLTKKQVIKKAVENHIPMLTICGSYQLFGRFFKPFKAPKINGLGIFDAYTIASKQRKIGNIIIESNFLTPQTLVGFENHSGNTFLNNQSQSLGRVKYGIGNNDQDKTEGAKTKHCLGCYLHGSLLPRNPHLTDWLIQKALDNIYSKVRLTPVNDQLELKTHQQIINRVSRLRHPLLKYFV